LRYQADECHKPTPPPFGGRALPRRLTARPQASRKLN
jgi:hypothetical protein